MALQTDIIGYTGRQHKGGFAGYDANALSFILLELEFAPAEVGESFYEKFHNRVADEVELEGRPIAEAVESQIAEAKIGSPLALAGGVIAEDKLHLITRGTGAIYVIRGGRAVKLISGDHMAVGQPETDDRFIFTNSAFIEALGGEPDFLNFINSPGGQDPVTTIPTSIKNPQLTGAVFMRVHFGQFQNVGATAAPQENESPPTGKSILPEINLGSFSKKRRLITFLGVILVFTILIWSVVLGYHRREEEAAAKRISDARVQIESKLAKAADEAFLNPETARNLITESYQVYEDVKRESGTNGKKELAELETLIKNKEGEITHKEEKPADEFFDLSLDTKNATGSKMALMGDSLVVLDDKRGAVYTVVIEKKSMKVLADESAKSASIVSGYDDTVYYFVPGSGLYSSAKGKKPENIIANDPEWGSISDIAFFNGNAYFLDRTNHQIHKYLAGDNAFSAKKAYFAPDAIRFKDTPTFAIDSSVYIGDGQTIYKYTGGSRDKFTPTFPESGVHIDRVLTTSDLDRLYVWDKKKGTVYIFSKEGEFEKQVQSADLAKASAAVVHDSRVFLLINAKIYTIELK